MTEAESPATLWGMDTVMLAALLDIVAQVPAEALPVAPAAPAKLTTIGGLTTLEIILISTCGTLSGVVGIVWKWGNDIRKENAAKFDKLGEQNTKLVADQTADNKDIVHAMQDMTKTMADVASRLERLERRKNGES